MNPSTTSDIVPLRELAIGDAAAAIIGYGQALRNRGVLSPAERRALRATDASQIEAICEFISQTATSASAADDRDRLEAARAGVLRASLLLDLDPGALPALRALDEALARRARDASDEVIEAAPSAAPPPRPSADHLAAIAESVPGLAPPPEALDAFLSRGVHAAWVRAWADASLDVDLRLGVLFEEAEAANETLSLQAWRWHRSRRREVAPVPVELPLTLAADDGSVRVTIRELGSFDPVPAEGRVVLRGTQVELRVIPSREHAIRDVRFGDARATQSDLEGIWTVEIAWRAEPVLLRVEGADGSVFEETMVFTRDEAS